MVIEPDQYKIPILLVIVTQFSYDLIWIVPVRELTILMDATLLL